MSLNQALFRLGLVIYMLSFFLVATGDSKGLTSPGRLRGFECAYFAVQLPLTSTPFSPDRADYIPPFMYLSTVISGLINPVFVVHAALASLRRNPRVVGVLKFALLSMIPFCWVVLYDLGVYPREGHVFWVIGMLLVLIQARSKFQVPINAETGKVAASTERSASDDLLSICRKPGSH